MYEQGLGKIAGDQKSVAIPTEYTLYQNYPNPFNPETMIRFDLPKDTKVKIDVFNVLGQRIKKLIDKQLPAGQHFVLWRGDTDFGATVASGIYIYRIKAGSFIEIKKMLYLK
jgi:hypothetical protein